MNYNHLGEISADYLEHYGVLGMKWGIRRYQNADGTLTAAGQKRYKNDTPEQIERSERRKAKVKKFVKRAAKVAAVTATGALALSALTTGTQAGAVVLGKEALGQLLSSGAVDNKLATDLVKSHLSVYGTKFLRFDWNKEKEILNALEDYYLENRWK